ncbi:hypothetical protein MMC25_002588 [Agyrium rufum]|nr:hypothetical protein [Agyrium rufum]
MLQPGPKSEHGHGEHDEHDEHDDHGEEHEESHDGEEGGEEKSETSDEGTEKVDSSAAESDKSDDSESDGRITPGASPEDTERVVDSGKNVEGVQFKGATNATDDHTQDDTRKHVPDAKGGAKKRIESAYGNKLGEMSEEDQKADKGDAPATAKTPGNDNTISGKQEGISNTDTKHSTDIANDPDKSKKAEGGPDTAKVKGSVDPSRPAK